MIFNYIQRCQACIVDMNYHCLVTMNCVGSGNGRIHLVFLVIVFILSSFYLLLAIAVEHSIHCPESHGVVRELLAYSTFVTLLLYPPFLFHSCGTFLRFRPAFSRIAQL